MKTFLELLNKKIKSESCEITQDTDLCDLNKILMICTYVSKEFIRYHKKEFKKYNIYIDEFKENQINIITKSTNTHIKNCTVFIMENVSCGCFDCKIFVIGGYVYSFGNSQVELYTGGAICNGNTRLLAYGNTDPIELHDKSRGFIYHTVCVSRIYDNAKVKLHDAAMVEAFNDSIVFAKNCNYVYFAGKAGKLHTCNFVEVYNNDAKLKIFGQSVVKTKVPNKIKANNPQVFATKFGVKLLCGDR
jgi:hypothetical protein